MGGSNILDSSAMEAIALIQRSVASIQETVAVIPVMKEDIAGVKKEQARSTERLGAIKEEQVIAAERLASLTQTVKDFPSSCPYVTDLRVVANDVADNKSDVKKLRDDVNGHTKDITEVKTNQKWYTGGNALFTAVAVFVSNVLNLPTPMS